MPLEKQFSTEAYRTLKVFGWATKLVQDSVMCLNCHRQIHPVHKGWADYHAEIKTKNGPISIKVECKSNRERFNFEQISPDQRNWLHDWQEQTDGQAYIWLQLGDERVGTANAMARRVWLVPVARLFWDMDYIEKAHKVKYVPINKTVAELENMRLFKANPYTNVEDMYAEFAMEWLGSKLKCWRPNENHPLWEIGSGVVEYDKFTSTAEHKLVGEVESDS